MCVKISLRGSAPGHTRPVRQGGYSVLRCLGGSGCPLGEETLVSGRSGVPLCGPVLCGGDVGLAVCLGDVCESERVSICQALCQALGTE